MNLNQFKLALERLQSSDWAHFERLSSDFLSTELPSLRTMAAPSGDGGRDSELFSPEGNPMVVIQYSIAKDWRNKVRKTVIRLKGEHPTAKFLIYMSNQQIGGQADDLKRELMQNGLMLDIRDRNWFLERALTDAVRENAARQLIDTIARPYLTGEDIINKRTSPLTTGESKAALVYLGLQWQDDITEKGLTKLSFDALVRAALRHTNSDRRMGRQQIRDAVSAALPSTERAALNQQVDSALQRLTKRFIRHWQKEDEFCLTHDEYHRILNRLAEKETEESEFNLVVEKQCSEYLAELEASQDQDFIDLKDRVVRILEQLLLRRGEVFVEAVLTESLERVGLSDMTDLIFEDITTFPPNSDITEHYPKLIFTLIQSILAEPTDSTHLYLRRLANSYTLFSFLNQTPDVQSATRKLFSHGTIWVDTTVLLPLFAEQLKEDENARRLTRIFNSCIKAGVELRVTSGIVQEVNAHMNNALMCSEYQHRAWRGRIPYLYSQYLHTGSEPADFSKWLSLFRGAERPEDDIMQFLNDAFSMTRQDLNEASLEVADRLRWALDRLWTAAHRRRRKQARQADEDTTRVLIRHDVESYLGIVALRKKEEVSELGYRHWLMTFDTTAWEIRAQLRAEFKTELPSNPLISLSFLLNYLTFGPSRSQIGKEAELKLPLLLDVEMSESFPHDIIEIANSVRRENEKLPEYVIRRKVRDAIDRARRKHGSFGYNDIFDNELSEPDGCT